MPDILLRSAFYTANECNKGRSKVKCSIWYIITLSEFPATRARACKAQRRRGTPHVCCICFPGRNLIKTWILRHPYSVFLGLELELRNKLYLWAHNCRIHPEELMHFHLEHLVLTSYAIDWTQHGDSFANSNHLLTLLSGNKKGEQTGKAKWSEATTNFSCLVLDTAK